MRKFCHHIFSKVRFSPLKPSHQLISTINLILAFLNCPGLTAVRLVILCCCSSSITCHVAIASFYAANDFMVFNMTEKWSPALQIRTVLLSIQALLSAPNPDDPLANDVAEQWKVNEAQAIETGNHLLSSLLIS